MKAEKVTDDEHRILIALSRLCNISNDYIKEYWRVTDRTIEGYAEKVQSPLISFYRAEYERGEEYGYKNAIHFYLTKKSKIRGPDLIEKYRKEKTIIMPNDIPEPHIGPYFLVHAVEREILRPFHNELYARIRLGERMKKELQSYRIDGEHKLTPEVVGLRMIKHEEIIDLFLPANLKDMYLRINKRKQFTIPKELKKAYEQTAEDLLAKIEDGMPIVYRPDEVFKYTSRDDLNSLIELNFNKLSDREKKVLDLRYGLSGKTHTLSEIGDIINKSGNRANTLAIVAIRKIRNKVVKTIKGRASFEDELAV